MSDQDTQAQVPPSVANEVLRIERDGVVYPHVWVAKKGSSEKIPVPDSEQLSLQDAINFFGEEQLLSIVLGRWRQNCIGLFNKTLEKFEGALTPNALEELKTVLASGSIVRLNKAEIIEEARKALAKIDAYSTRMQEIVDPAEAMVFYKENMVPALSRVKELDKMKESLKRKRKVSDDDDEEGDDD